MYVLKFLLAEGEGRSLRNPYSVYYVHRGYRTRTGIVSQVHTLDTVRWGDPPRTHTRPSLAFARSFWSHSCLIEACVIHTLKGTCIPM